MLYDLLAADTALSPTRSQKTVWINTQPKANNFLVDVLPNLINKYGYKGTFCFGLFLYFNVKAAEHRAKFQSAVEEMHPAGASNNLEFAILKIILQLLIFQIH